MAERQQSRPPLFTLTGPTGKGGPTVITHMWALKNLRDNLYAYFRYGSKTWTAIQQHIAFDKNCFVIERRGQVAVSSGSYGIEFKDAHTYIDQYEPGKPPTPAKVYALKFVVHYDFDEDDEGRSDQSSQSEHYIDVPIALELNFTQAAFDRWLKELRRRRNAAAKQSGDYTKLRDLVGKHPEKAAEFLKYVAR